MPVNLRFRNGFLGLKSKWPIFTPQGAVCIYGIDTLPGNIDELTEDQLDEYVRNQPLDNKFGVMSRVRAGFFYFKPEWCAGFWGSSWRFKGSNVL